MISLDFSGKTVLVTGATRGIGRAIGDAFEACHANLVLTGTNPEMLADLQSQYPDRCYLCVDLTHPESLASFLEEIERKAIDICINCAGGNIIKDVHDFKPEDYDYLQALNLRAPFLISQVVSRGMKDRLWGRIVNIASIWGSVTKAGRTVYTTTKTGLLGMTRAFSVDLADYHILVNAVSPGFTRTELTEASLTKDQQSVLAQQIPLQRFAEPDEIAKTVLFLASEHNSYLTGQNIVVDGGFTNV